MDIIPNQRKIRIKKPAHYKSNFYFAECAATHNAYKDLNGSAALGLYLYFLTNQADYEFKLFKDNVEKTMGIKRTAFYNGMNTLQEKGYLVFSGEYEEGNPILNFYETPQKAQSQTEKKDNKTTTTTTSSKTSTTVEEAFKIVGATSTCRTDR